MVFSCSDPARLIVSNLEGLVMKGAMPAGELQDGYIKLGELAKKIAATLGEWESTSGVLAEMED